jgi:FtsH-binding integral membrane protein
MWNIKLELFNKTSVISDLACYGGLVLFGMFLLYDTQKIIKMAENYPTYAVQPYDPING